MTRSRTGRYTALVMIGLAFAGCGDGASRAKGDGPTTTLAGTITGSSDTTLAPGAAGAAAGAATGSATAQPGSAAATGGQPGQPGTQGAAIAIQGSGSSSGGGTAASPAPEPAPAGGGSSGGSSTATTPPPSSGSSSSGTKATPAECAALAQILAIVESAEVRALQAQYC